MFWLIGNRTSSRPILSGNDTRNWQIELLLRVRLILFITSMISDRIEFHPVQLPLQLALDLGTTL